MKQAKRCSECGKVIREHNESGLCEYHVMLKWRRDSRKKKREGEKE